MRKILVDVDDTLVIYKSNGIHPYGFIHGDPFEPNKELIDKLKNFDGEIIIWSGGGVGYAQRVAEMVLPDDIVFNCKTKGDLDIDMVEGDVIVDDQKEYFTSLSAIGVKVVSPFEDWG